MELTVDMGIRDIVDFLNRLPANQIAKIKNEFSETYIEEKAKKEICDFQEFLLSGPVMSNEQYEIYKQKRNHFNLWRLP